MTRKVIISGGTGLIGTNLCNKLTSEGYKVHILTRSPGKHSSNNQLIEYNKWSVEKDASEYRELFEGSIAVINLAGANLGEKRWTDEFKKVIYNSRIDTTKKIVEVIGLCNKKPLCLISASGTNIYKDNGNNIINEESELDDSFLAKICKDWESAAEKASELDVRVVCVRTGVVLDRNEGAIPELELPFKLFLGGPQGNGKQYFSWIHLKDIIDLYYWAITNQNISGPLNGTSPNPARNKDFCKRLGKALGRPSWLPVPGFALKLVIGEFAESLLVSLRVIPEKALNEGFNFSFPVLENALKDIFKND